MNRSAKLLEVQRVCNTSTRASSGEQQSQPYCPPSGTHGANLGQDQPSGLNRRGRKGTTALVQRFPSRTATVDIAAPADSDGIARRLWCRALVRLYLRESEGTMNGDRMGVL